jgi:predicted nucleic acid-binding protein
MAAGSPDIALGDTNVFVGLFATPGHPLHERAVSLFRRVADGELALVLTGIVASELCFVVTRVLGWPRRRAAATLGQLLEADGLIVPEGQTLRLTLDLYARNSRLAFPDAYLAARALDIGPAAIATFDRALGSLPGIRLVEG